jgi:hypothetical protein
MSTRTTQHDAVRAASRQASLAEFLGTSDDEEPDEITDSESSIDYSQPVFVSNNGNRYHAVQVGVIPGCPDIDGRKTTLSVARANGDEPCKRCNPIDYREDADHATEVE